MVPTSELRPSDDNPRYITEERFAALRRAVVADPEHFRARPCIARLDGTVVAGNMRLRAAQAEELAETPTFFLERPEETLRTLAIRDNVPYGEWDETLLAEWVYDLSELDVDLVALTGLAESHVEELLAAVGQGIPDDVLPPNLDERNPPAAVRCPECGHEFVPGQVEE